MRSRGFRPPCRRAFTFTTGAYPNQLNNIGILGQLRVRAQYRRLAERPGALRRQYAEPAVGHQPRHAAGRQPDHQHAPGGAAIRPIRRNCSSRMPWAIAFKHSGRRGLRRQRGEQPCRQARRGRRHRRRRGPVRSVDPTRVLQIPAGKNPRGIVVNADRHPRVRHELRLARSHRDRPHHLTGAGDRIGRVRGAAGAGHARRQDPRRQGAVQHLGRRVRSGTPGGPPIVGRMSNNGWGSARAATRTASATTSSGSSRPARGAPSRSTPTSTATDPHRNESAANWSAERDEEEDFELNIRAVSGGAGLIVLAGRRDAGPECRQLPPTGQRRPEPAQGAGRERLGRDQGVRPVRHPARRSRRFRHRAGCRGRPRAVRQRKLPVVSRRPAVDQQPLELHAAARSRGASCNGQFIGQLRNVGTFDPAAFNEVTAECAPPLGADGFAARIPAVAVRIPADLPAQRRRNVARRGARQRHPSQRRHGRRRHADQRGRSRRSCQFLLSIDGKTPIVP